MNYVDPRELVQDALVVAGKKVSERDSGGRATRVRVLTFSTAPMRAFHLSWIAFFLSFVDLGRDVPTRRF